MIALALGLQWTLFLAVAAVVLTRRQAGLGDPLTIYLVFHGLVFVLRPTAVHLFGFDDQWRHMRFTPDAAQFVQTLAVASLGLLTFAGAARAVERETPAAPPAPPEPDRPARQGFALTLALLLPPALYGAWMDAGIFGSFAGRGEVGVVQDPRSAHTYFQGTTAYIVKAHNLLIPLAALGVWLARYRWWSFLPLLAALGYRAYLGSRWGLVVALAIVLLLYLHDRNRRWPRLAAVSAALPLLAGFHALGENRDALRAALALGEARPAATARAWSETWDRGVERLDTPSFANFDYLAYVVAVVPAQSRTYSYFTQHLALFTRPIPRVLWPDKPRGPPIQLVDLNAHGWFGTRTVSLPGDGWRSAGWLGVALTCGAVGAGLSAAYGWYRRHRDRLFPIALYCCYLPTVALWYRGGELVNAVRFGFWMVLPVLLWWGLSRMLAPATPAKPRGPT